MIHDLADGKAASLEKIYNPTPFFGWRRRWGKEEVRKVEVSKEEVERILYLGE